MPANSEYGNLVRDYQNALEAERAARDAIPWRADILEDLRAATNDAYSRMFTAWAGA